MVGAGEQCTGPDPVVCWEFAEQWMFFVAYLVLAATFLLIGVATKSDKTLEEPIDDESRHAFDDWFKDAKIDATQRRQSRISFVTANPKVMTTEETAETEGIQEKKEETPSDEAQFESFMELMKEPTSKDAAQEDIPA
jgi:hypothetical protein